MAALDYVLPGGMSGLFGGGGGSFNPYATEQGSKTKKNQTNLFSNPLLLQALFLSSQSGQNPFDFLKQFSTTGAKAIQGAKGDPTKLIFGTGKGTQVIDIGALSAKLPELAQGAQQAQFKSLGTSFDALFGKNGPAFLQNVGQEAQGTGSIIDQFGKNLGQIGQNAIGASSFGYDPNAQKYLSAPLALQFTQFQKGVQDNAQNKALNLIGGGALPGAGIGYNTGAQGASQFYQPLLQLGGQYQQASQFGQQMDYQNQQTKYGLAGAGLGFLGALAL